MGFNLIYWTPLGGSYFLLGSNLEKYEKKMEKRQIWPDWGNTTWADLAGLGSIGLCNKQRKAICTICWTISLQRYICTQRAQ